MSNRLARYPWMVGVGSATLKTGTADILVQKFFEKREQIDRRRLFLFTSWGFLWMGCVQFYLYSRVFVRLFPNVTTFVAKPWRLKLHDRRGLRDLVSQISIDQFVHSPFFFFPVFYLVKDIVETQSESRRTLRSHWSRALDLYARNAREDLIRCWSFWIPAFAFNFSFCPIWMRLPFVSACSFFWTMGWSMTRGAPAEAF